MKKKSTKPDARQSSIIELLRIIDQEGLHYGIVDYGVSDPLKVIKDEKLNQLVRDFQKISVRIEKKLENLQKEVAHLEEED